MLATAVLLGIWATVYGIHVRRDAQDKAAEQCKSPDDCGTRSLRANIRAANANEDTVDVSVIQLVLGIFGIGGVGYTVFYARKAWREAERTADATVAMQRPWLRVEIHPTGKVEVFPSGSIYVPMQMNLINEGGTPALFVSHGEHGHTHVSDNAPYELYWPVAELRAVEQAQTNPGFAVFPGREMAIDLTQVLGPDLMETDEGQFTFSFGVVVTYQWTGGGKGSTKITAQLMWAAEFPHFYPDSWRFNLPALQDGVRMEFEVVRREFADEYT